MFIETIIKVIAPAIAIIMAIVAYIKYRKIRFSESKLEVTIIPKIYLSKNLIAIKVSILMANKGTVVIKAKQENCFFEVKKFPSDTEHEFVLFDVNEFDNVLPSPIYYLIEQYGPPDPKNRT